MNLKHTLAAAALSTLAVGAALVGTVGLVAEIDPGPVLCAACSFATKTASCDDQKVKLTVLAGAFPGTCSASGLTTG